MKKSSSAIQSYGGGSGRLAELITMTFLLLAGFAASFSMNAKIMRGPLSLSSETSASRFSTVLSVATETNLDITSLPELGKDGVYHISNPEQHKALIEANKDKLIVMKIFAPWCRACKGLEPRFNAIVRDKQYENIPIIWADLTIQNNKEFVKSIGVVALPSMQFYSAGLKEDTFPCGPSKVPILKKKLAELIHQHVDSTTLKLKEQVYAAAERQVSNVVDEQKDETVKSFVERERSKLRSIPFLSSMLESEFESALSKSSLLTFDRGSIIMREGNVGRTFYVIMEGEVEICQRTSYEDPLTTPPNYLGTVINRFVKGEFFGERALITGEPRAASIRTSTMTKCLVFDKEDFPASCVLSGQTTTDYGIQLESIDERYGVALIDEITSINDNQYLEAQKANQARGSPNTPNPIDGVDNDDAVDVPRLGVETDTVVPLLMRFKLIRLVARCFDYMVANTPRLGDEGARRRRNMLVKLLSTSQQNDFNDAYKLLDKDGDGEVTVIELRRLMDSIGEEKSDEELLSYIETGNQKMDGKQVITCEDFMGIMAEAEFYYLFLETFRALDKEDSGFLRASDLNRVLCGVRDLITDDHKSIIDVEDDDMSIDYEQFSKMLLGTALK